jgi:hypothetical protein
MADYFPTAEGSNDAMASNGAEAPQAVVAVNDTAMDDEML